MAYNKSDEDIENETKEFRDLCQQTGVIDKFAKLFATLFFENIKPEDCLDFSRKYVCPQCITDEQYEILKYKNDKSLRRMKLLEQSLDILKKCPNVEPSGQNDILNSLWHRFQNEDCIRNKNLLRRYLTLELFEELKHLKTKTGYTFYDCAIVGFKFPNTKIGIYACDNECYKVFHKIFDPIIRHYHNLSKLPVDQYYFLIRVTDYGKIYHLIDLDPTNEYISSTQIRSVCSISDYPFVCGMDDQHLLDIENKFKQFLKVIDKNLNGTYYSLKYTDDDIIENLRKRKIYFTKPTLEESAAGIYNNWPIGRGVYVTESEECFIWINYPEHLKIFCRKNGGHLRDICEDFMDIMDKLSKYFTFSHHLRYGKLNSDLSNIGNCVRASVYIRLPNLSQNPLKLEQIVKKLHLELKSTFDGVEKCYQISTIYKVHTSEYEILKLFQDGVLRLIELEKRTYRHYLSKGFFKNDKKIDSCNLKHPDDSDDDLCFIKKNLKC